MIATYSKNHTALVREINLQDLGAFLIFDLGLRPRSKIKKAPRSCKCIYTELVQYSEDKNPRNKREFYF